jgi:hypothetical protein
LMKASKLPTSKATFSADFTTRPDKASARKVDSEAVLIAYTPSHVGER